METLVGKPVVLEHPIMVGTETVVGRVITPLTIMGEEVTLVTVEGMVVATHIKGLPLPIEIERPITLELVPITEIELL